MTQRIRLGDITCPSGDLVIIDGGYLGIWSGEGPPDQIDPALLGIDDPGTAADIRDAVDFEVVGPDAAFAMQFLKERLPVSLYDLPASSAKAFAQAFETLCRDNGVNATLRVAERVPHRQRARAAGNGAFQMFGVPAVAVHGLPTDRPLWVEAAGADGIWESIDVMVSTAVAASSERLGEVGVDWARLAFADADALSDWEHDEAIDGLADVVFWGRSQERRAHTAGPTCR